MSRLLDQLVLHPSNREQLKRFLARPAHALLITAPVGSGKYWLAKHLAAEVLGLDKLVAVDTHAYFIHLRPAETKQEIAIDDVRAVTTQLRLKTIGRTPIRRMVLIENAQAMSLEAQKALLKMLEEPPADTLFILTATSPQALLPTIVSRAQRLELQAVELTAAQHHFASQPAGEVERAWRLSGGRMGLLSALLSGDETHPLKEAIAEVREFLAGSAYERVVYAQALMTDRLALANFIDAASRVMQFLHHAALAKDNRQLAIKLQANRELLSEQRRQLAANAQARLVGLQLALRLRS